MKYEESNRVHVACPPTKVNEWVDQQLAAIKAEAEQSNTDAQSDPRNTSNYK